MDNSKIITRINNLEAAATLILDECRKTKELLGDVRPPAARKGAWTDEKRQKVELRRMKTFLKHDTA